MNEIEVVALQELVQTAEETKDLNAVVAAFECIPALLQRAVDLQLALETIQGCVTYRESRESYSTKYGLVDGTYYSDGRTEVTLKLELTPAARRVLLSLGLAI